MAPMQVSLRSAMGVLKDQTSISLAKVANAGMPELDVAIVKATSHDDAPMEEKYVQAVLQLTSFSRSAVTACVQGIARRLNRTHDWIVALKALMLAHRILRDGDSAFEEDFTLSGRRGMRILNASDFRDEAHSNGWDFSAFIHAYSTYLDERLEYSSVGSFVTRSKQVTRYGECKYEYGDRSYSDYNDSYRATDDQSRFGRRPQNKAIKDMKMEELLESFPIFQRILDRILCCRPAGMAKVNRLVNAALYLVVRESFFLYTDIRDGLAILFDAFFHMEVGECRRIFDMFSNAAKQIDDLISFYSFCKALGIWRSNEYPVVEKISDETLETMQHFLRSPTEPAKGDIKQPKSPVRRQENPQDERGEITNCEVNRMKALPPPLPIHGKSQTTPSTKINSVSQQDCKSADLLNINEPPVSVEERENKLALALFPGSETKVNNEWESFSPDGDEGTHTLGNSASGWELALVEVKSDLSKSNGNELAGGFSNLLLDNLYEQGEYRQKMLSSTVPSGSASSVAMPGQLQKSFLSLPAPPGAATALSEDPFAASLNVPPPAYVQMSELRQKQQLLAHEQQQWILYQQGVLQANATLMKYPNSLFASSFPSMAYSVPSYGVNPYHS
ncbi:hypothetical protein KP509_14G012300 [Ceratopteris richardii]|uniref:ENTH domain-containing protein n=1 Tax=Ceratopteris richardii TaxID=49495 RepID=A0A8T2T750_CERRI|nr:hypothetical protein KP509_14G012300 [Ceratopteris richardii]KAH7414810.1 hypothetical protein KP509_14G012300 [Ceratopteris richardii]